MSIETVRAVEILPTEIWIENSVFGQRSVVMQHKGCHPFVYAVFNYDHFYTDNAGTHSAAIALARSLGAPDPVQLRRAAPPPVLTAGQIQAQIDLLTGLLPAALARQSGDGHFEPSA